MFSVVCRVWRLQLYDSASAALNAYIADFHSSHPREKVLTGNLNVSHRFPSTLSTPRVTTLRNKDGKSQRRP